MYHKIYQKLGEMGVGIEQADEWLEIFGRALSADADVIYSRLNSISDLTDDPQVTANDYITTLDHPEYGKIQVVGVPCKFSKTSGFVGGTGLRAAPELGQHTGEVILEAGYARADIAGFKDRKII